MKVSELDKESREILEEQVEEALKALGLEADYKAASELYRAVIRTITRRNSTEDGPADARNRKFVITSMVIWDVRNGLDNAIEEAQTEEPIEVYGMAKIIDEIADMMEMYFEAQEEEIPEPCTRAHLHTRRSSLKTSLNRSDTNKCTFRIYFQREEIEYMVTVYIEKGE